MPIEQIAALIEPSIGGLAVDPELIDETVQSEEGEAQSYLEHIANALRQHGLTVRTECPQGAPVEAIVKTARQGQADLIALTSHGRSGLQRLVFGSVADGVLRRAPCPVLLVRSQERPSPPARSQRQSRPTRFD
jgi:nucleotide-binding universal stress UspA family protein